MQPAEENLEGLEGDVRKLDIVGSGFLEAAIEQVIEVTGMEAEQCAAHGELLRLGILLAHFKSNERVIHFFRRCGELENICRGGTGRLRFTAGAGISVSLAHPECGSLGSWIGFCSDVGSANERMSVA